MAVPRITPTGDREPHHLLDRIRDHPVRTGLGAASLTFLVIALPPVVGFIIYRLAKALKVSGAERFAVVPLDAVLHPRRYRPGPAAEP